MNKQVGSLWKNLKRYQKPELKLDEVDHTGHEVGFVKMICLLVSFQESAEGRQSSNAR